LSTVSCLERLPRSSGLVQNQNGIGASIHGRSATRQIKLRRSDRIRATVQQCNTIEYLKPCSEADRYTLSLTMSMNRDWVRAPATLLYYVVSV
jgi:hypothetical protein